MPTGPGDASPSWTGTARSAWAAPVGASMLVGAAVCGMVLGRFWGLFLAVLGLAALPFTSIGVTIDERGLRVEYGMLRWPVSRVGLEEIEQVTAIDLRPAQWGGWGYRGSRAVLKRAAVVLRAGPAIEMELVGGRRFAVTVDDAEVGARALQQLVRLLPPSGSISE